MYETTDPMADGYGKSLNSAHGGRRDVYGALPIIPYGFSCPLPRRMPSNLDTGASGRGVIS